MNRPKYKELYIHQNKRTNRDYIIAGIVTIIMVIALNLVASRIVELREINKGYLEHMDRLQEENTELKRLNSSFTEEHERQVGWTGEASYYSWDGCIGCNAERIMANGEVLDDTKRTLAFNYLPMNTMVVIENLANNMITTARVTDTGGFTKLGRIADLSVATKNAINCEGLCNIKLTIK